MGTATDVYQPIEGHYKLTRRSLEALANANTCRYHHQGPMVVRDKDVLLELSRRASYTVYVSVPTVDEDAWRILEPGTAHPLQRLRAVRELNDAGIRAGVLMNPIVPGLTSQPAKLEQTIKAIADHGAGIHGHEPAVSEGRHAGPFHEFPRRSTFHLWPRNTRVSIGAPTRRTGTRKEVRGMVKLLQKKYRVSKRDEGERNARRWAAAAQQRSSNTERLSEGSNGRHRHHSA